MNAEHEGNRKIPKTMSTQHPDNVNQPEWSGEETINGSAEVFEAYYAYNVLGCQEVMWDSEGKDVDTRVVRKLVEKHWDYFAGHTIGEDIFLTYRVPNPKIERAEKKYLVETLQNIPVAYDVASLVYKREVAPIFEVILPFTTDGKELIYLHNYYKKVIASGEEIKLHDSTTIRDWIGDFKPKAIKVIPLVEDFDGILHVDKIVTPYIEAFKPKQLRVFIARSDPALNYGLLNAVFLSKIALSKLKALEKKQNVKIHPILGVGSKPFRGHLSPDNVDNFLQEYKGLSTVTIQSGARYDYPLEQVKECINILNERLPNGEPTTVETHEEEVLLGIMAKCKQEYEKQIETIAPLINGVAAYVPPRRARKLHIGLFGYSRCVAGVCLPRAISFAASLYSIGIPPEFIGLKALSKLSDNEWKTAQKHYVKMTEDLTSVGGLVCWENINMLFELRSKAAKRAKMNEEKLGASLANIREDLLTVEKTLGIKLGPKINSERKHANYTNNFLLSFIEGEETEAKKALIESAKLRRCLG